jgi:hypothetical protein
MISDSNIFILHITEYCSLEEYLKDESELERNVTQILIVLALNF